MKKSLNRGLALRKSKGFTLIELLVVIAIIGILAAIILASLATARSKGVDAGVKSDLDSVRSQMELFASNNANSYSGGCAALGSATPAGAGTILAGAQSQSNSQLASAGTLNTTLATAGAWNTVTCHASASNWATEAPLSASKNGTPIMWCVDSNGNAKQETTNLAASVTVCT